MLKLHFFVPEFIFQRRRELLRALVALMKSLAAAYCIMITATTQRAATEEEVKRSYTKLIRKVHPDKGGSNVDFRKLHTAYSEWRSAARKAASCQLAASKEGSKETTKETSKRACTQASKQASERASEQASKQGSQQPANQASRHAGT